MIRMQGELELRKKPAVTLFVREFYHSSLFAVRPAQVSFSRSKPILPS